MLLALSLCALGCGGRSVPAVDDWPEAGLQDVFSDKASETIVEGAASESAAEPDVWEQDSGGDSEATGPDVLLPTAAQGDRLDGFLKDLTDESMKGRLTGAPSGMVAEDYVRQKMTDTGMEVVLQPLSFALYESQPPIDLSILSEESPDGGTEGGLPTFEYQSDYREIGFSGSGSVTGPLLFLGDGTEEKYSGWDVTGAIVVVVSANAGFDYYLNKAYERGARGVIFVPAGPLLDLDVLDVNGAIRWSAAIGEGVIDEALLHSDLPVAFVRNGAVERLLGVAVQALPSTAPFDTGKQVHLEVHGNTYPHAVCNNVLGILRGEDLKNETIVLGGHYDHIGLGGDGRVFYGASDNAAGTAIVLETAASLGQLQFRPRRTILFALFCAEEQGLLGSKHYVNNAPYIPLSQTKLLVNLDYLGESADLWVHGWLKTNALQTSFLGTTTTQGDYLLQPSTEPFECRSDECPFHKKQIPFLRYRAESAYYHRSTDTYEHLDRAFLKYLADIILQGMGRITYL